MQTVVFQLGKPASKWNASAGHILECFPPNFKRKAGLFKSNKICELEFGFPNKYIFNFSDLLSENYVTEMGKAMTSVYLRVP